MGGRPIRLSESQEIWLKNHYSDTKNADIAQKFSICEASVTNLGRKYGLKKSDAFMKECLHAANELSKIANSVREYHGCCIPGGKAHQYKKGESYRERYGAEADDIRRKAAIEGRKKLVSRERARILFGLPQKTNLKLVRQSSKKIQLRYRLRKRGYIVDDDLRVAYYTDDTKRSRRTEAYDQPYYTFEPAESCKQSVPNL